MERPLHQERAEELVGRLTALLGRVPSAGWLGGSVRAHVEHSVVLAELVEARTGVPASVLDLGSGAGVPGLVLAACWPESRVVLLEAHAGRCAWLRTAIGRARLARAEVVEGRAEELGHRESLRERFTVVTARAFARPAVTAEVGTAFVAVGGRLVVSEPPEAVTSERWPEADLRSLGLGPPQTATAAEVHAVFLVKTGPLDPRWPRRVGIPAKRPRW